MTRVVLITGLPGSGKTCYARTQYVTTGYHLVDDPAGKKGLSEVYDALRTYDNVVICDPHLIRRESRSAAIKWLNGVLSLKETGYSIVFVYFANDPKQCAANIKSRADGRLIEMASFRYEMPEGIIPRPVWRPAS